MKRIFIPLALLFVSGCVPEQQAIKQNPWRIEEGARPWVIAHGGAKELWPENTMQAFKGAAALGVDALEMDVNLTRDNVLVTLHDATIEGSSDGEGRAIDFTYNELQAFNFGEKFAGLDGNFPYKDSLVRIPRLADVLAAFPGKPMLIEIKNTGTDGERAAQELRDLINAYGAADRVLIAAFDDDVLDYFTKITTGSVLISAAEEETTDFVFSGLSGMEYLFRPDAAVVAIPTSSAGINLSLSRIINSAHRRNMAVQYWTINDKEEMRMLIERGADGLITDRPDIMKALLTEMGF